MAFPRYWQLIMVAIHSPPCTEVTVGIPNRQHHEGSPTEMRETVFTTAESFQ
ncbi:MAG: hypothetical protein Q6L60_14070 [Thermostichus sp. HHBFW_bins_43]